MLCPVTFHLPLLFVFLMSVQPLNIYDHLSVGRGSILGFTINDGSVTFVPTLKYVLNLRLSQQQFPTLGQLAVLAEIAPLFKKCNSASAIQFLIFFLII